MELYIIEISNNLDSSLRIETVLSEEPLTKNSDSLMHGLIDLNDFCNEKIYNVYAPQITINAWTKEEFDEMNKIKNSIIINK